MPSSHSLGIAQVEVFDPERHPDATYAAGAIMRNGRRCRNAGTVPNPSIVEISPHYKDKIVYERWCPILKRGDRKIPGQVFRTETWQLHVVNLDDEEISVQIYWTKDDIQEHAPMRKGADALCPLRDGIQKFGKPRTMKVPDLAHLDFEQKEDGEGDTIYEIYYRLLLQCDGANIRVKWQIALPGTEPYNGELLCPRFDCHVKRSLTLHLQKWESSASARWS